MARDSKLLGKVDKLLKKGYLVSALLHEILKSIPLTEINDKYREEYFEIEQGVTRFAAEWDRYHELFYADIQLDSDIKKHVKHLKSVFNEYRRKGRHFGFTPASVDEDEEYLTKYRETLKQEIQQEDELIVEIQYVYRIFVQPGPSDYHNWLQRTVYVTSSLPKEQRDQFDHWMRELIGVLKQLIDALRADRDVESDLYNKIDDLFERLDHAKDVPEDTTNDIVQAIKDLGDISHEL